MKMNINEYLENGMEYKMFYNPKLLYEIPVIYPFIYPLLIYLKWQIKLEDLLILLGD